MNKPELIERVDHFVSRGIVLDDMDERVMRSVLQSFIDVVSRMPDDADLNPTEICLYKIGTIRLYFFDKNHVNLLFSKSDEICLTERPAMPDVFFMRRSTHN